MKLLEPVECSEWRDRPEPLISDIFNDWKDRVEKTTPGRNKMLKRYKSSTGTQVWFGKVLEGMGGS